jgi:hypothetical protein
LVDVGPDLDSTLDLVGNVDDDTSTSNVEGGGDVYVAVKLNADVKVNVKPRRSDCSTPLEIGHRATCDPRDRAGVTRVMVTAGQAITLEPRANALSTAYQQRHAEADAEV